jgi:hypothetical protein
MKFWIGLLTLASTALAAPPSRFKDVVVTGAIKVGSTVGTVADTKAALEISSTTKGLLPPRMTQTQRDAISSPPTGLHVYNTTLNELDFFNGTVWGPVSSGGGGVTLTSWSTASPVVPSAASFGTITGSSIFTRRVGDTLEARGTFIAGTVTGTAMSFAMPTGLSIDSAKMSASSAGSSVGVLYSPDHQNGSLYPNVTAVVFFDGASTGSVFVALESTIGGSFTKNAANQIISDTRTITFDFRVPIFGW